MWKDIKLSVYPVAGDSWLKMEANRWYSACRAGFGNTVYAFNIETFFASLLRSWNCDNTTVFAIFSIANVTDSGAIAIYFIFQI